MLPRGVVRSSWIPTIKMTCFARSGLQALSSPARPASAPKPLPLAPFGAFNPADKVMPTPLIEPERLQRKECGTGHPAQRGSRKPMVWKRRDPWFSRQWTLDLKRESKGPETPHFPEGTPFTLIRKFQSFAGRSWKVNAGRRRKTRLSLKRGRRKLL